jgi:hypothetical protein
MRVLLKLLIIMYNTIAPSTLTSVITSLEIMLLKRRYCTRRRETRRSTSRYFHKAIRQNPLLHLDE